MIPIDVIVNCFAKGDNFIAGSVKIKCKSTEMSIVQQNQKHRTQNCASSAAANSQKTHKVSTMSIDLFSKPSDDWHSLIIVLLGLRSETVQDIFGTKWIWPHAEYSVGSSRRLHTPSRHSNQPSSGSRVSLHSWPAYCCRRERYSPDHAFNIHLKVEAWQCRAERSCIVCSTIFQSQHDSTKPTAAVQILGFPTHTWRWQYEIFYCSETYTN
jgi:hypothetical protein